MPDTIMRPNSARIYDYFLGGNHNFAVDRQAAEQLLARMPSARGGAKLNRWFLLDVVKRLAPDFGCFLDLASGIPTRGYIHEIAPAARVLYNDADPVTVSYGREIIGANPNVLYTLSDLRKTAVVLNSAGQHFGKERRIAICFVGAAYFFTDDELRQIFAQLHAWCAPGSRMALSWLSGPPEAVAAFPTSQFARIYTEIGTTVIARTMDEIRALMAPWQLVEPGIMPLSAWLGLDDSWRETGGSEDTLLELYGVLIEKGAS